MSEPTTVPDWARRIEALLNGSDFSARIAEPFDRGEMPSLFQFVKATPVSAVQSLDGPRIVNFEITKAKE